ncbi:conserved hypothetical protein [Chloroherpeton thalassium ATCC 35110]|uniref:Uncharacterized protein n=1 Tax=Chloroherpeton thalassium (strain ATCC 35110 / GB-78) TaxID=517418 RepID=B3QWM9_CHLT3|nr:DNA-binding domain-containing protein [Chloroherpeton thalassium]ACF14789.1 conserved hypothetical protein [Chloroherpeton thalassium ATCC 35110]
MIKYALMENLLTARTDDYMAQPQDVRSHDLESITEKMLAKGTTITKTDTVAVLNSFFEVVSEITRDGESVNTELINTGFSIQGVFLGATDTFDSKRHSIKLNVNPGKALKKSLSDITLEKTASTDVLPQILEVKDSISGSVNESITSSGVVEIKGSLLKIEGDNQNNGVVFLDAQGAVHKVTTLVDNKPARLIVLLPALPAGEYTLQITTQYSGGTILKTPRTGTFNKPLTVV